MTSQLPEFSTSFSISHHFISLTIMAKRVGRDVFGPERRAELGCYTNRYTKTFLDTGARHGLAMPVRKKGFTIELTFSLNPLAKALHGLWPEWQNPFFPAFAVQSQRLGRCERHVRHLGLDDFRDSSSGVVHHGQQYTISYPALRVQIGSVQQGVDLLGRQESEQPTVGPLLRNGHDGMQVGGPKRFHHQ